MSGDSAVTTTETNQNSDKISPKDVNETEIKSQILTAIQSRVTYLRNKSDCFTFSSVRRLLEEDLGLEKFDLDVYKSFVQEHLVQCLEESGNASETSQETERKKSKKDKRSKEDLMSDIKKALRERSFYIKDNAETITMASLRRLLEEDLELEKSSLDPFKKFINKELDEVLQLPDAPKRSSVTKKKVGSEEVSDSDVDKEEVTRKRKSKNDKPVSEKKKAKHIETDSENDSDAREERIKQTKETGTAVYGKRVEHLKSIIKSCGMSVPPSIYRKAKQASEEKREAILIEELEQILAKEGLSSDPSEKEIKEVKKRKGITKELEGIDTSNIVSSSRRKSTTRFVPPPKPKIVADSESESDEPEESENEEDVEEDEVGNEEAEEGSQSEEESNNEDDGGEESE